MKHLVITSAVLFFAIIGQGFSDTFRNKQTGETFNGFATQVQRQNEAKVFVQQEDGKLKTRFVNLNEYEIVYNRKGRRDNVIVIPITNRQTFASYRVCEKLAKTIEAASNRGPYYIILEIDSPGGRGDYTKLVIEAVRQTDNCPVITYVNGGTFGGVYSIASLIAVASDAVYFAPGTAMSSEPPLIGGIATEEEIRDYQQRYSADSLSAYGGYAASIARKRGRPEALTVAMIDNTIDVVEVRTAEDGKTEFINRLDKLPSQQIVKNWSRAATGLVPAEQQSQQYNVQAVPQSTATATVPKVTNLTAQDAVKTGMADGIAVSRTDLLEKFDLTDVDIIENSGIRREIRAFNANQNAIRTMLANVDYLENRADQLKTRLDEITEFNARGTRRRESYYDNLQDQPIDRGPNRRVFSTGKDVNRRDLIKSTEAATLRYLAELENARDRGEVFVETETVETQRLRAELASTLDTLLRNYTRILRTARGFPGALPMDVSVNELQRGRTTAANLRQDVLFGL
ncbi:hypothetical protein STSP2_01640 [Anaerohalosphaera lusitana]|uniref:Signal peptide peptidase SppA, 36K type n=1 Tax=Anaerohalosphaera lusitana TaxID=1936003 RepID=A0A1U9NLW2_9BACT|nr:hypothetical protein [Anaerohalosphaera lusitana]AQT68476.1 hypothetical protein STSP2_01640 [Anaerohalosphaera lusitana]